MTSPPLTWRVYYEGDLERLAARPDMAQELAREGTGVLGECAIANTITRGLGADAEPIACGFVVETEPCHFELSALVSAMTPREWVFATCCLRVVISWLERDRAARSIAALVRADFAAGIAYLERFGFVAQSASVVGEGPLYVTMIRRR